MGIVDRIYNHTLATIDQAQSHSTLHEATNLGLLKLEQVPLNWIKR